MPAISIHLSLTWKRLPIGSFPGQYFAAIVSSTTATRGRFHRPCA